MKRITLAIAILALTHLTYAQSMKDFKWMEGTWERQNVKPGSSAFENWKKIKDGYTGMGISMKGTDTTFVEKLSLVSKEGNLYYVAEVSSNSAPTYFKVTSVSKTGFVCENPEHDFPKKIEYSLDGNKMTAVISDGGEKKMGFQFVKKD